MTESEIQTDIMKSLLLEPKVAFAYVTSAGKIQGRGGHWFTIGIPGLPDIMGMLRTGHLFGIEVKKPGKKPTKIQLDFIDDINRAGGVAGWCDSVEGAQWIIRND